MRSPRDHLELIGHEAQQAQLLQLIARKKLPQTLLLQGAQGIGKATFAYRLAGHLLTQGGTQAGGLFEADRFALSAETPAIKRLQAGSHGDLLVIEPEKSGQNQVPIIKVEAARDIAQFFNTTAAESAWRIAIIDGAEALNVNAANAILKIVEEPPLNGVIMLVCHKPGALLPTLRSRCRVLAFQAPSLAEFQAILALESHAIAESDMSALYTLARGSAGEALRLQQLGALDAYLDMLTLLRAFPQADEAAIKALYSRADKMAKEGGWPVFCDMWQLWLQRLQLAAIEGIQPWITPDEAQIFSHLCTRQSLHFWLEQEAHAATLLKQSQTLHLDRKHVIHELISTCFNPLESAA